MNEELKEILAGMTAPTALVPGGGIGSLSISPGMAQAGDFYGVREPSDSMMIEQGVMPDMSQLEGLTGFEKLQQMQNMGMINPNVDIYDDSMIYNPERDEMDGRMRELDLKRFEIEQKIMMLMKAGFSEKEATQMALFGVGNTRMPVTEGQLNPRMPVVTERQLNPRMPVTEAEPIYPGRMPSFKD